MLQICKLSESVPNAETTKCCDEDTTAFWPTQSYSFEHIQEDWSPPTFCVERQLCTKCRCKETLYTVHSTPECKNSKSTQACDTCELHFRKRSTYRWKLCRYENCVEALEHLSVQSIQSEGCETYETCFDTDSSRYRGQTSKTSFLSKVSEHLEQR